MHVVRLSIATRHVLHEPAPVYIFHSLSISYLSHLFWRNSLGYFSIIPMLSNTIASKSQQLAIKRNVDPSTGAVHPGSVNAQNVRDKLSKQLRIDLEDHETVQLVGKPVEVGHAELEEGDVERIMEEIGSSSDDDKDVEIRQLGEFMAKITLRGDHVVPLKFAVIKR